MSEKEPASLADLRAAIPEWRRRAIAFCHSNPALWTATLGVPLREYLAKLDELEKTAAEVENKVNRPLL